MNPADFYMDEISRADKSDNTLFELWEQYAAENNAAAENTDCADGSRAGIDDGIEQLSFTSTLRKLFKRNPNKSTQWFPKVLKVCSPRSLTIDCRLNQSIVTDICQSVCMHISADRLGIVSRN